MAEEFGLVWDTIARVDPVDRVDGAMASALAVELAKFPIPRIGRFHAGIMTLAYRALTWELWEAANLIHGEPCSQDAFCYFRLWLIAQGEDVYEAAVSDADSLADHPKVAALAQQPSGRWADQDFPQLEDLLYAPQMAFDMVLDKLGPELATAVDRPDVLDEAPAEIPLDLRPARLDDEHEVAAMYPRLTRLFRRTS